jgi:hypothetical protein
MLRTFKPIRWDEPMMVAYSSGGDLGLGENNPTFFPAQKGVSGPSQAT